MLAVGDELDSDGLARRAKARRSAFYGQPEDEDQVTLLWDGEWEVTYVTFRDMGAAFGVALLGIYILVVAQFGSFKLPLVILTPIPLTFLGIIVGHWLFDAPFSATSMIGFIALAGIIVRNSILLVDFIRHSEGPVTVETLIEAGAIRFKPILLTAIAAMIGAVVILADPIFQGLADLAPVWTAFLDAAHGAGDPGNLPGLEDMNGAGPAAAQRCNETAPPKEEEEMAHVVVLGAGLGGTIMAYELKDHLRQEDKITVVTKDPKYHFVPSNPWIAVGWRDREDITVDLAPAMAKHGVDFIPVAAEKLHADENRIELVDGQSVSYDYLVIATGPELAFDEIEGLGPHGGYTQSICHIDHAEKAREPSSRSWSPIPARSSSARCRAQAASARPTSSSSSWRRHCGAPRSATAYR